MEVKLRIANKSSPLREIRLSAKTLVGRSVECQLRVVSMKVSRRHCELRIEGESVVLRDLGSANGTRLNGRRIPQETDVYLDPGSSLQIGPLQCTIDFTPSVSPGGGPLSTASDSDVLSCLPQALDDEETRDLIPRGNATAARPGAAAAPGAPGPPQAIPSRTATARPSDPGDTAVDGSVAAYARDSSERARERAESVLEGDSSVDLPTASRFQADGDARPRAGDSAAGNSQPRRGPRCSPMPPDHEICELPRASSAAQNVPPRGDEPPAPAKFELPEVEVDSRSSADQPPKTAAAPPEAGLPAEPPASDLRNVDPELDAFLQQFRPQP